MNENDIAEQAYKNGYEQALKDLEGNSYRTSWKGKFFEAKEENERLTEERNKYKDLYETMYRKWSDLSDKEFNCEALRKERNEYFDKAVELQKQVEELTAFKSEAISLSLYGKGRKDGEEVAVKDTADKIFRQVLKLYQGLSKAERETMTFEWKLLDLAVEYGVEVE